MKRIYKKRKNDLLRQEALETLRSVRKLLRDRHPNLFKELEDMFSYSCKPSPSVSKAQNFINIDRDKNINTVLQYMSMKSHSPESIKRICELMDRN